MPDPVAGSAIWTCGAARPRGSANRPGDFSASSHSRTIAVTTSGGGDRLEGGAGNDTLGGGNPKARGRDRIFGGPGRDEIYARDGVRDYINCGPGKDVVSYSDRSDRAVGCEKRIVSKKEYLASALDSADDGSSTNDITRKVTVTFGLRR